MDVKMDRKLARKIVDDCNEFYKRWGNMANKELGPYSTTDLLEAIDVCLTSAVAEAVAAKEELTLARRQLTASKAREAKLRKQLGKEEEAN